VSYIFINSLTAYCLLYIWKCSKYQPPIASKKKKKFTEISATRDEAVYALCSPEQRSLARKMGCKQIR
jgi:hypothetical protein